MHAPRTRFVMTLAALGALAACSSPPAIAPQAPPIAATPSTTPQPPAAARAGGAVAPPTAAARTLAPHLDPANTLAKERVVYFAFDSEAIDSAGRAVIERHARYLASNPALAIKVEGHADEQGSAEYNLALGQRRAEAVRRALALLGVPQARVEATSWGEEHPVDAGRNELAWARNRRGELVYPSR